MSYSPEPARHQPENPDPVWKRSSTALIALLIGSAVVYVIWQYYVDIEPGAIQRWTNAAGFWAPAMGVLIYVVLAMTLSPTTPLNIATGIAFGLYTGITVGLTGTAITAIAGYYAALRSGKKSAAEVPHLNRGVIGMLRTYPITGVLLIRLVGVLPFAACNYALGLAKIRPRDYVLGSVFGFVPGTVASIALGAYGISPTAWQFWVALAFIGLLAIGASVLRVKLNLHANYTD